MKAVVEKCDAGVEWDLEVDVLVVGAGACGLAAAIAAHDAGASVAILEKRDRAGGNSSLSTGSVPGAGSRFQRAAGIDDSADRMIADLERTAGASELPHLTRVMACVSAELCEWLVDTVGARIALITDYCHVGHSVPRLHAPVSRRGQDLVDDLLAAVAKRDIPLATNNAVTTLFVDEAGAIAGAAVQGEGVESSRIGARAVILATNGFAANRALVGQYCAEIAGAEYFGALGSEGEAVLWGEQLGARLANMQAYQGYAAVAYPHGSLLSWTTIEKGGILVNAEGARFGDEDLGYSGYARLVLAQQSPVYAIFDDRIKAIASKEEEFQELVDHGGVKGSETVEGLAAKFGLPAHTLAQTLADYNAAAGAAAVEALTNAGANVKAVAKADANANADANAAALNTTASTVIGAHGPMADAFARTRFGLAPLTGTLWICRVTPGLFHTQGGLAVDDNGHVLRADGTPIAGLYAGGGAAAGISGSHGATGYASGNGLLTAIGLGYLAGRDIAKAIA